MSLNINNPLSPISPRNPINWKDGSKSETSQPARVNCEEVGCYPPEYGFFVLGVVILMLTVLVKIIFLVCDDPSDTDKNN